MKLHRQKQARLCPLFLVAVVAAGLCLAGCYSRVAAKPASTRESYLHQRSSALSGDDYTGATRLVLHRYGLEEQFRDSPNEALEALHQKACTDDRRDLIFALAELNYLHAGRRLRPLKPWAPKNARDYYLSSAIYAYLYLLGEGSGASEDMFDSRSRVAGDIYNRSLAKAFASADTTNGVIILAAGQRQLPAGVVDVRFDHSGLSVGLDEVDRFLSADDFIVHGLTVLNRHSGLGAPLIGIQKLSSQAPIQRHFPATIFLRVSGDVRQWSAGQMFATLEVYSAYNQNRIMVNGRSIPLESDITTPLAHALNNEGLWKLGRAQFLSPVEQIKSAVYPTEPHEPGRIPVVFIHGTFSSPVWWAEMWNTLQADPVLAARCEFWNYIYNSGNAVAFSAANFRDALTNIVQELDPGRKDKAMEQMVLVGHSQGGLLAKMAVTDPGDRLWKVITDRNFDDLKLTPEQRTTLKRCLFFTPVPFVKRVVFISTPHRGSFRISLFLLGIGARLVSLPLDTVRTMSSVIQQMDDRSLPREYRRGIPNSLDSMSPDNKVQSALADFPPVSGVVCNSIISIKGDGDPKTGNDGVVKYESAHVDYAESEFIVRSSHSCLSDPATIEELRRILLKHLQGVTNLM